MIPNINLMPEMRKRETKFTLFYFSLAIIFICILIIFTLQFFHAKNELTQLKNEENVLVKQKEQLQIKVDELMNARTENLEQSLIFVENIAYPVSPLFIEVSDLLIDYSYLRTFALAAQNLTLVIDFETMNDVSKYINQLEHSLFFTDVQVRAITTFEPTDTESTDIFTMVPRYETTIDLQVNEQYVLKEGE